MAKAAGLNRCLPRTRMRNLEPIASSPAAHHSAGSLVRSNRLSDRPVIAALRQSKPTRNARQNSACAASVAAIVTALCNGRAPRSNQATFTASNAARLPIWNSLGSGRCAAALCTVPSSPRSLTHSPRKGQGAKGSQAVKIIASSDFPCAGRPARSSGCKFHTMKA